jgi:hypothetical protein
MRSLYAATVLVAITSVLPTVAQGGPSQIELEQLLTEMKAGSKTCAIKYIGCGVAIESALTPDDCTTSSGYLVDFWQFLPFLGHSASASVLSNDFSPLLLLLSPTPNAITLASSYTGTGLAYYFYGPVRHFGFHTVAVSTAGVPGETGSYRLRNSCGQPRCSPDHDTLCMADGRYTAEVTWTNQYSGQTGRGVALPQTSRAGYFAFDNPENVELLVKVLDFGDGVTKVFFGQLTDLQFELTIRDNYTGAKEVYRNTSGECGGIDQDAFDYKAALQTAKWRPKLNRRLAAGRLPQGGTCVPSDTALCLLDHRFRVEMDWQNQYNGTAGTGGAKPYTNLAGQFYFTDPSNIEVLVKILDFGDQILVLYGALSDLEYTLHITDTITGERQTYNNPPGNYCGGIDRDAF